MEYLNKFNFEKLKKSKFLNDTFWTILGSGFSRFIMIGGTMLTANILGLEKFGEFGLTRSTINMILTLGGLNIGTVITKYVAEHIDFNKKKLSIKLTQNYFFVLILISLLSILVYFNSSIISNNLLKSPRLDSEIKLSVFVVFFGILTPLNEAVFRGLKIFKKLGRLQIIGGIFFAVLIPLGAYLNSVYGAITGYLLYTIIILIYSSHTLFIYFKKNQIVFFTFEKNIFKFKDFNTLTLPVFLTSFIDAPFFWYTQVLLITYSSFAENGVATALLQIRNAILIIPGYITMVALPYFTKINKQKNNNLFNKFYLKSIKFNLTIALVTVLPFLFFSKEIMNLFGNDFVVDFEVYLIAFLSIPLLIISSLANQSLISKNVGWLNFYISLIWNLTFLCFTFYFLKYLKLGVFGYFMAMFIGVFVFTSLKVYFNYKIKINE